MTADDPIDKYTPRQEGMTREMVLKIADKVFRHYPFKHELNYWLAHDALQRETITRLEAKVKDLEVNQVIPCLPEHAFEIAQLQASLTASEAKYHELIMAVGSKHPDETRHQTALRYIRQSEQIQGPLTPREE